MSQAEKCPVCNGSGKWQVPPPNGGSSTCPTEQTCHGCGGKGWVEVGGDYPPWYPTYPWNPQMPYITYDIGLANDPNTGYPVSGTIWNI